MIKNIRIFNRGAITFADQIFVSGTNFISSIILGRILSKSDFGIYSLVISGILIVNSILNSLITTPYCLTYPQLNSKEKSKYFGSVLVHLFALIIINIFAIISIYYGLKIFGRESFINNKVWILILVITFFNLREFARQISFAILDNISAIKIDIIVAGIQICGLIILEKSKILNINNCLLLIGFSCAIPSIIWIISKRKHANINLKEVISDLRLNWKVAKWLFAGNIIFTMSIQIYPWMLIIFQGSDAAGILAASSSVLYLMNPLLLALMNFLVPYFSHVYADGGIMYLKKYMRKISIWLAITMGMFCALLIIFGGQLIVIIYGRRYMGTGSLVTILAISHFVSTITFPLNAALLGMKRPDIGVRSYFIALIIPFSLGIWLIKYFGPIGVGISLICANVLAGIYRYISYKTIIAKRLA